MANGYESQRVGRRSGGGMEELMQILKMFQGGGGGQEKAFKRRVRSNIYDEFQKGADSFDNTQVQDNLNKMEQYYSDNVSNMSSEEIDLHSTLKDKFKTQIERNNEFSADNKRRFSFGGEIMDFANEYSDADNTRNFSWKTTTIKNGKMVQQDNIVDLPNPDDYDGGEDNLEFQKANDKAIDDLGGLEGYSKKREEYKKHLKNEIQKQIGAYGDYQEKMITNYGASGRLTSYHIQDFQELDESYSFIVDSLNDDGVFDDEERDAYKSAILQKSSKPIQQFIAKDTELKDSRREVLLTEMQTLKTDGDTYQLHKEAKDILKSGLEMSEGEELQTAITLDEDSPYNDTGKIWNISYKEMKEALDNPEQDPNLAGYLNKLETNLSKTKKELKIKDSSYMKNDGGSFIEGMEEETWAEGLHDEIEGYLPTVYGAKTPPPPPPPPPTPSFNLLDKKEVKAGIKNLNPKWAPRVDEYVDNINSIKIEINDKETSFLEEYNFSSMEEMEKMVQKDTRKYYKDEKFRKKSKEILELKSRLKENENKLNTLKKYSNVGD